MRTEGYDPMGLDAIFASFAVGVTFAVLAVVLVALDAASARIVSSFHALGVSPTVAAILLYLVFRDVFGCPGRAIATERTF